MIYVKLAESATNEIEWIYFYATKDQLRCLDLKQFDNLRNDFELNRFYDWIMKGIENEEDCFDGETEDCFWIEVHSDDGREEAIDIVYCFLRENSFIPVSKTFFYKP